MRLGRLVLTCRLYRDREGVEVLAGKRATEEEDVRAGFAGRFLRDGADFFNNYWQSAHPTQAGETALHVASVVRPARM